MGATRDGQAHERKVRLGFHLLWPPAPRGTSGAPEAMCW
jgi:hypothetical protein